MPSDIQQIDEWNVREKSLLVAEKLGYPINRNLPKLNEAILRTEEVVFPRMACVFIASACAFGLDRQAGLEWLRQEGFDSSLSAKESAFLAGNDEAIEILQSRVESLYVLAWSLGYVKRLDMQNECEEDLVQLFPNPLSKQPSDNMRMKSRLRPVHEIFEQLDLYYCLNWATNEAQIKELSQPGDLHPAVIFHRRWALEWLLYETDWEDVSMDT